MVFTVLLGGSTVQHGSIIRPRGSTVIFDGSTIKLGATVRPYDATVK